MRHTPKNTEGAAFLLSLCIDRHVYSKSTKMCLYTLFVMPFTELWVGEVIRVAPEASREDLLSMKMAILRPRREKVNEIRSIL